MNPTIKARIESIRRGEVPEGYKRTKIGIVPNEWNVEPLKSHLIEYRHLSNDIDKFDIYSSSRNGLMLQSAYYSQKAATQTNLGYKIVPNGYVTYRHMSDDDIFHFNINRKNKTILVSAEYPVFNTDEQTNTYFLIAYLNSMARFRYFCRGQKMGGTRTRLYFNVLGDFKLAFPSIPEQEKIAEILSGQDRVIALKEQLLAEKQKQKKYLMQQLLTGKKRLPGFSGEWDLVPLRNLLRERKTYSVKGKEYPHVTLSNEGIYPKTERYDREHLVKSENKEYKITYYGDICYNPANLKFGAICINNYGDAIFSPIYVTFEVYKNANLNFLGVLMMSTDFINAVRKYEEGTVYERMAVKPEDLLLYKVKLPALTEQTAIAEILSTADKEIELLKKDIEQEKLKKKSLMQLLLTGIVRVDELVS